MKTKHNYKVSVKWTGNTGNGTSSYTTYDRSHTITVENKSEINCSADSVFRGDKNKYNPEELFLASISSCHLLWYLHLCADNGITVTDYVDSASGIMIVTSNGSGHFAEVTLNPIVTVTDVSMIEMAIELHKKANEFCFIANSVNFPVYHNSICKVG